jgi:hypothetical protein
MKISNISTIKGDGTIRVEAEIKWEDKNAPPFQFYIQTEEKFRDSFWPDPNALLIACLLPAWGAGEKRISLEGTLCPILRDHMQAVFMAMKGWYPDDFGGIPVIEASHGFKAFKPKQTRAISLLSCGIDSLAILKHNNLLLPDDHPDIIKAALFVSHNQKPASSIDELKKYGKGRVQAVNHVTADLGIDPVPVNTNLWWLNPDNYFFSFKSHGAQLCASQAFFSNGYHKGYIASSFDGAYMNKHWGSHPLVDTYYSSSYFKIEHSGVELTRMEKTKLVADWPVGLQNIRVCQNDSTGSSNCGTCEKCIRTMTMLEALGKLRQCRSFPENDIDTERLEYLRTYDMLFDPEQVYLYKMAIPLLKERHRLDLVKALESIFNSFFKKQANA